MTRSFFLFLFSAVILSLHGCGGLQKQTVPDHAQFLKEAIQKRNSHTETIKGLGHIKIGLVRVDQAKTKNDESASKKADLKNRSNSVTRSRVAWMAKMPNMLRLEAFDVSGVRLLRVVGDGRQFTILHLITGETYSTSSEDPDLKLLTSVPVRAGAVIQLLMGRIPVSGKSSASIREHDGKTSLVLSDGFFGKSQVIVFDEDQSTPVKIEHFSRFGSLLYTVELGRYKGDIPKMLTITDKDGNGFSIHADRVWPGTPIAPEKFKIDTH